MVIFGAVLVFVQMRVLRQVRKRMIFPKTYEIGGFYFLLPKFCRIFAALYEKPHV